MIHFLRKSITPIIFLVITSNSMAQCQLINNVVGYTPTSDSKQLVSFNWLAFDEGKVLATGKGKGDSAFSQCHKTAYHHGVITGHSDAALKL